MIIRCQDVLDLFLKSDIAGFQAEEDQVPVPNLIFSVLAQDFQLLQRVVEDCMPVQDIQAIINVVD